jgi:hypothetical protein
MSDTARTRGSRVKPLLVLSPIGIGLALGAFLWSRNWLVSVAVPVFLLLTMWIARTVSSGMAGTEPRRHGGPRATAVQSLVGMTPSVVLAAVIVVAYLLGAPLVVPAVLTAGFAVTVPLHVWIMRVLAQKSVTR